jgi:hypothetical protein
LEGLCQAFMAGQGKQGKNLDAAAFSALAEAAGGAERIPAYCQAMQQGDDKPKEQKQQAPPDDQGQGQSQGGPPPSTGSGYQGQGGPPATRQSSR